MPGIPGDIASELGELGKNVGSETAKVATDIVGAALESLGSSGGQKTPGSATAQQGEAPHKPAEETALEQYSRTTDESVKKAIARASLKELAGGTQRPKEPTVAERLAVQKQEERKKEEDTAAKAVQMAPVAPPRGKRRGDLYGIGAKQSSEKSRNVRQD